ncbi:MAG: DUF779 domain-containing protein [Hyphomicrobium sp.]
MPIAIAASPEASRLIASLIAKHGAIAFHMSGRYGTTLVCLPHGELRLGERDVLVGDYCATLLYMMSSEAGRWRARAMTIRLARGYSPGFSLEAGSGFHFELTADTTCGCEPAQMV